MRCCCIQSNRWRDSGLPPTLGRDFESLPNRFWLPSTIILSCQVISFWTSDSHPQVFCLVDDQDWRNWVEACGCSLARGTDAIVCRRRNFEGYIAWGVLRGISSITNVISVHHPPMGDGFLGRVGMNVPICGPLYSGVLTRTQTHRVGEVLIFKVICCKL